MPTWRAVVFDLDDTLYPERDFVLSGFRAVADWAGRALGVPADAGFASLRRLFEEGVRGETFDRWLDLNGVAADGAILETLVQVYRAHEPVLTPFPEVPGLLRSLRQRYRLGLVSDGFLAVQQRKLAALGLAGDFDAVVFSDMWGREHWKPSRTPFIAEARELSVETADCVYVADNPRKDFIGARGVGMYTMRIARAGGEYSHLLAETHAHDAHVCLPAVGDVDAFLEARAKLP